MPDDDPLVSEYVTDPITIEARHPITGLLYSELPYLTASWSDVINNAGSFDVTVPLDDLEDLAFVEPNATALYFVRSGRALFGGLVDRRTANTKARTVRVAGKGFLGYLDRRKLFGRNGMTYAATAGRTVLQIEWSAIDQFRIVKDVVDHLAQYPGNLAFAAVNFIGPGAGGISNIPRTKAPFYGTERKAAGALINEFAKLDDGFDLAVLFPSYDASTGPRRELNLYYPRRGRDIDTSLEQGRNVVVLTDDADGGRSANPVSALGAGTGDAIVTAEAIDTSLLSPVGNYVRLDGDVALKDVADLALLSSRATATLSATKKPVRTFDVELTESLDLTVGAVVTGDSLAVIANDGSLVIDEACRIIKINPTLTPEGWVKVKLALAQAGASTGDA